MAASVASSTVVFMFWLVCPVFSYILAISFPRDKLLDFRQCTPPEFSPVFNYSDVLLDIVFGGAAVLFKRFSELELEARHSWSLDSVDSGQHCLPSIWQISALYPTTRTNSSCSTGPIKIFQTMPLCFMETWLNDATLDSALNLPNFQLIRAAGLAFTSVKNGVQM